MPPTELSKARRRIKQLEQCLSDVQDWMFERFVELNGRGADRDDNPDYQELKRLKNRINRTVR